MAVFDLPDFVRQSGASCAQAQLSYRSFGALDPGRSNCILFPTPFGATSAELDWIAGKDGLFDANRYFIVVTDTFGNGLSTSPYMSDPAQAKYADDSCFSVMDNVNAQRIMLRDVFGVEQLALVAGWSMGGQQAYQWGAAFPDAVRRIAVICGSARTAAHNWVFLEGVRAALQVALSNMSLPVAERHAAALRLVGRLYAGWALSQTFYRDEVWRALGYGDLESFIIGYWEASFLKRHPSNLLAQIGTWQAADISGTGEGDPGGLAGALGRITAPTYLLPCRQDLYFRVEDNERELPHLRRGVLRVMESPWGHRAGLPINSPPDRAFLRATLDELLDLG